MNKQTILLLIRHGETDWNVASLIQGQRDIPLNANGRSQAKKLAQKMKAWHSDIVGIYSSDLERAFDTAQETASFLGLDIVKSAQLRERNFGEAEGLLFEEITQLYGENQIPGAETAEQVLKRAKEELHKISSAHSGEKIAIFTHGLFIRTLLKACLNESFPKRLSNCSIVEFYYSSDEPHFHFVKIEGGE